MSVLHIGRLWQCSWKTSRFKARQYPGFSTSGHSNGCLVSHKPVKGLQMKKLATRRT
jgi:hypothetical protein